MDVLGKRRGEYQEQSFSGHMLLESRDTGSRRESRDTGKRESHDTGRRESRDTGKRESRDTGRRESRVGRVGNTFI